MGELVTDRSRARRRAEFLKGIAEARKLARQLEDRLARLEEIAAEGQTSTEALVAEFRGAWERLTGDRYVANEAGDRAVMRRLLKSLSADDIRDRMRQYFMLTEAFYQRNRWSLTVFGQAINSLGAAGHTHVTGRTTTQARSVASQLEKDGWFGD